MTGVVAEISMLFEFDQASLFQLSPRVREQLSAEHRI